MEGSLVVAVEGVGALGARCARQLVATPSVGGVVVRDPSRRQLDEVVASLGAPAVADGADPGDPVDAAVVVVAGPAGTQLPAARAHLAAGRSVVATSDDIDEVRGLLDLDAEARERGAVVAVGAGFAPGLTDLLAAHAASAFDTVVEIHVAKSGTGGPACARAHHRALTGTSVDWRDGDWLRRPAGSGRELAWFPDPLGALDCYRAVLPDALVLAPAFPGVERVTARLAATRRDRLTAGLPMLRRPHAEGGPGGVRVEVRGRRGAASDVRVLGAMDRPAVAGGAVAAVVALAVAGGAPRRSGAAGLAELFETLPLLHDLAERGVRAAVFEGTAAQ
jgi:hypothetical protein